LCPDFFVEYSEQRTFGIQKLSGILDYNVQNFIDVDGGIDRSDNFLKCFK